MQVMKWLFSLLLINHLRIMKESILVFRLEWGAMQHLHGNKRNRMYFIVARRVLQWFTKRIEEIKVYAIGSTAAVKMCHSSMNCTLSMAF